MSNRPRGEGVYANIVETKLRRIHVVVGLKARGHDIGGKALPSCAPKAATKVDEASLLGSRDRRAAHFRLLGPREAFFLAWIELTEDPAKVIPGGALYPGLAAEVMIVTGKRTAMDYLLSPINVSRELTRRAQDAPENSL